MSLPILHTDDKDISLLQTNWSAQINPVITNPANLSLQISADLIVGVNVINHGLGRMQQGWVITDINSVCTIYRSQPFNALTLTLVSSAVATVSLGVF